MKTISLLTIRIKKGDQDIWNVDDSDKSFWKTLSVSKKLKLDVGDKIIYGKGRYKIIDKHYNAENCFWEYIVTPSPLVF